MADLRLHIRHDGAELGMTGDDIALDGGFDTAVNLSLFTDDGWWGDTVDERPVLGGSKHGHYSKNDEASRLQRAVEIRRALTWMIDAKIAEAVEVKPVNISATRTDYLIAIKEPGEASERRYVYAYEWQSQRAKVERA